MFGENGYPQKTGSFWESGVLHLVLIVLFGLLAYSNTFHVPFVFDDIRSIIENPRIKDFSYFTDIDKAGALASYKYFQSRVVGFFTFALNYKLNGLNVIGYHIFNLAVHIINALLVYLLVTLSYGTPALRDSESIPRSGLIALFASLLFVSHPIQTQAVTYIVQRFTSLATMFYLLSLVLYIKSRSSEIRMKSISLYALSIISAVLAMKTKEIAFTLPIIIVLYEFMFFQGSVKKRLVNLIPILLTLFVIPLSLLSFDKPIGDLLFESGDITRLQSTMSRWDYLFTQFRVIVTYIRLLFLPVAQRLDYVYPVFHSFSNPQVFLSFLFLASIFGFGIYLLRFRNYRLVSFGIFWFFVTLSVESSVIPIIDVIFEHRVYLPNTGAALAVAIGTSSLHAKLGQKGRKALLVFCIVVVIALGAAAWSRNSAWRSDVSIWEDVVKKEPFDTRAYNNLCKSLIAIKDYEKAARYAERAATFDPSATGPFNNLGIAYAALGLYGSAIENYKNAARLAPNNPAPLNNMGIVLLEKGLNQEAADAFRKAILISPNYIEAHANLAAANANMGRLDEAARQYRAILRFKPDFIGAYIGLARIALNAKRPLEARDILDSALRIAPGNTEVLSLFSLVKEEQ